VTPTLDAAQFLRAALESVADQEVEAVEHLVIDGGSSDATREIARDFGAHVRLISEPALRQAAAVNRGIREARGDYVLVLNADDVLYPGALAALRNAIQADPPPDVVYADAAFIDAGGRHISRYPTQSYDPKGFEAGCFIPHAAALVRREALLAVGGVDERLDFAFDFDLWSRLAPNHRFRKVDAEVAGVRMHPAAKTLMHRGPAYREAIATFRRHFKYVPYPWVFGYANYLIDRQDQFFAPVGHRRTSVLLALPLGWVLNFPRVARYTREWLAARKIGKWLRER